MFIKEIKKRNKGFDKVFVTHRLVESQRTEKGPRHRTILNLGRLHIDKSKHKILADAIERILFGQEQIIPDKDEEIEALAAHYAELIVKNRISSMPENMEKEKAAEYEEIDIRSIKNSRCRTIGAEYIGLDMFRRLGFPAMFDEFGFSDKEKNHAALAIIGRLVAATSENATNRWAKQKSGIDELLGTDFKNLSHNALYRIADKLYENKPELESHLRRAEKEIFSLKEKIILYDLTNTYFEGDAKGNAKAKRGRSKEKRRDRPLLTLGLIIDEAGFPKCSKIMQGNVNENTTLISMIKLLQAEINGGEKEKLPDKSKPTVLMDAGISCDDNLELLRKSGYDYVCVARNNPIPIEELKKGDMLQIKKDKNNKIEAKLFKRGKEQILYCRSRKKALKEAAMMNFYQEKFEEAMKMAESALSKKGGTKKYKKVIERIGRLKERYSKIAQYYEIEVIEGDKGNAKEIKWAMKKQEKAKERFSGSYFLRSSRMDLSEKEIWELYTTLTNVEESFKTLKWDLNLRPIHHQKEERSDAHIFITILAYHILNATQVKLRNKGISKRWQTIRELMSSHIRITTSMRTRAGKQIYVRNTSTAERFHREIYSALQIRTDPLGARRIEM